MCENARSMGYIMGCVVVGNQQTLKNGQYDVYNYVIIKDDIIFINASDDTRLSFNDFLSKGNLKPIKYEKIIKYDADLYNQ